MGRKHEGGENSLLHRSPLTHQRGSRKVLAGLQQMRKGEAKGFRLTDEGSPQPGCSRQGEQERQRDLILAEDLHRLV